MDLHEDMIFDSRYVLKKQLGSGGFSEVWLVEDVKVAHKKMALKVYVPDKGLDDDGIQLFSSEFELVFDLSHTNLLRPAHFDVFNHSPYLLMPYCEHGSASKLAGRLDEEHAWQFLHDVASGLAFLHIQNPPIIHQDVKPDNILINSLGQYQITDFGISAKARSTLRKSMNVVKSGGTMAYMPPERFGKEKTLIRASDIWALGATLYELIAADMPFGEHGGLMQKSGADVPVLPGKWSKELQEIVMRCLQKDPWDRPVAQQIVEWTEKHFKGEKIVFDRKSRKSLTSKLMIGIGGGVAVLLLAFVTVRYIVPLMQNSDTRPQSEIVEVMDRPAETVTSVAASTATQEPPAAAGSQDSQVEAGTPDTGASSGSQVPTGGAASSGAATQTGATESPAAAASTNTPSTATPAVATPPAWLAEYDRILNVAITAYGSRDYARAKTEYNRALTLANRNGDRQKATFVNAQIAECNKAIEALEVSKRVDEEARQKQTEERLATYNFVGNITLGTQYLIVQQKSNTRWGIIRRDGTVAETCNYTQVSTKLKDGCYALRNEQGWTVFDTQMRKLASNLDNLNDYR